MQREELALGPMARGAVAARASFGIVGEDRRAAFPVSEWTSDRADGRTSFELDQDAGTLVVKGELDFTVERDFQLCCTQLLEGEAKDLLVDLTGVSFICSSCMGSVFLLHDNARRRYMKLRVRLSRKIDPLFRMMGLDELVDDIEVE